jgi:DNA polymerase III epsilon subunit family exonuclease
MEIMNGIANDKLVDIFYNYFTKREDNKINNQLKNLSKDEFSELVLKSVNGLTNENALMCRIYVADREGIKFNNELIKLSNLYLTTYPQGKDLIIVLSRLAEAYISEYEIEKALEVCEMLQSRDYGYIHSIYSECLYKLNRLDEAVAFLKERLISLKEKYGQEPDEKQQTLIESVANKLEKYKNYLDKGTMYIPATEKGRQRLGIKVDTTKRTAVDIANLKYYIESSADTDTFVAFDFETTGFSAAWDEIIEIGAVKVVKGKVVDKFSTLVKPYRKIINKSIKINGITNEMVADAQEISSVIPAFKEFINGYNLVGHNVVFDMKFLDVNLARIGENISCRVYDTLKLSRKYFKGMSSYKLTELSRTLNMEHTNAHRALSDAETTTELYLKCFNESR